jgi:hypothetical protein
MCVVPVDFLSKAEVLLRTPQTARLPSPWKLHVVSVPSN